MPSVTISRDDAVQRWPVEKKAPLTAQFDRDIEIGVVEHDQRVLAAHLELELAHVAGRACAWRRLRPVATEPVKLIASTPGIVRASPRRPREPRPMTRLKTPAGSPARLMMSASAQAQPGTRSAGLNTTALP